jgi:predicted permease
MGKKLSWAERLAESRVKGEATTGQKPGCCMKLKSLFASLCSLVTGGFLSDEERVTQDGIKKQMLDAQTNIAFVSALLLTMTINEMFEGGDRFAGTLGGADGVEAFAFTLLMAASSCLLMGSLVASLLLYLILNEAGGDEDAQRLGNEARTAFKLTYQLALVGVLIALVGIFEYLFHKYRAFWYYTLILSAVFTPPVWFVIYAVMQAVTTLHTIRAEKRIRKRNSDTLVSGAAKKVVM